jgi:hypothetical protein
VTRDYTTRFNKTLFSLSSNLKLHTLGEDLKSTLVIGTSKWIKFYCGNDSVIVIFIK